MIKSPPSLTDKILFGFLVLSFILSTVFKVISVSNNTFVITYDQGRDLIDIRHMVETMSPRLVGPTTSINGVLLGPFWYYFNLIPYIIFGGSPTAIVLWQILWFQLAILLLFSVLRRYHFRLAVISSLLLSLSPSAFYVSRFFWNANSMPLFTLLFVTTLFWFWQKKTSRRALLSGLTAGLSLQIEAAFGVVFFPIAALILLFSKQFKNLLYLSGGFLITLIPQLLFEIRHGFTMTKLLLLQFSGGGDILGVKIPFAQRWHERVYTLTNLLRDVSHIPEKILFPLILICFIVLCIKLVRDKAAQSLRPLFLIVVSFILFSAVFYLSFPQHLKVWYTLGLNIPLVLVFSFSLTSLVGNKPFSSVNIAIYLLFSLALFHTYKAQQQYLRDFVFTPLSDQSVLRNQLSVIDTIYQEASGQGFKVYSYNPAIYDYTYQYLFWWYGQKKYGYMPTDLAYLPNQPEYFEDSKLFLKNSRVTDSHSPIFLIIENPIYSEFLQGWSGNFAKYCEKKSQKYPFHVELKTVYVCQ